MSEISRRVYVSELVRRDQELSGYRIWSDELALRAMCSLLGVKPPSIKRPFAVISADDVRVKSVVHNQWGGATTSYRRVPVFFQGSAIGQRPAAEVRHDKLRQRPLVVQLPRLKPNDEELPSKLTEATANRLWEPRRARRGAVVETLGLTTTAAVVAGADIAAYSNDVAGPECLFLASGLVLMAGLVTTLNVSEKLKPGIPQLPPNIQPPLRIVFPAT